MLHIQLRIRNWEDKKTTKNRPSGDKLIIMGSRISKITKEMRVNDKLLKDF